MRRALNSWRGSAAARALVRRQGAALRRRQRRAALGTWIEATAELSRRRGLLSGFASPRARALRRAFNSWTHAAGLRAAPLAEASSSTASPSSSGSAAASFTVV